MGPLLVLLCVAAPALALPTFNGFFNPPAPPPPPPVFNPPAPAPAPAPKFTFNPPAPAPKFFSPPRPISQDCVYGQWTQWSACTAQCDATAFISRTRSVIKEASGYGAQCDPAQLEEWQECRGEACARDCVMGDWTKWSGCSATCDQGQRQRWRQILSQPINGGAACGSLDEVEPCNNGPCAVDCQMSQWSQWSQCNADCGQGQRQRLRSVFVPAQNGGAACGPQEEWEQCNNGPCARDCVLGDWAPWSQCPSCGQASRSRRRSIVEQGAFGGVVCDFTDLSESEACQIAPCPVPCQMEQWSAWSQCSASCDAGRRQRLRSVLIPAQFGGQACGPAEEWEACNNRPCAVDCQMTQWTAWSRCSADCGDGRRARTRSVIVPAQNGGLSCGPQEEWEQCNNGPCARDCELGNWAPWSPCPSCGQASRSRSRSILTQGAFGGVVCDFSDLSESESCNNNPCPVDCQMQQWSAWSQCSAQCGEGRRQRLRSIQIPAQFGGRACGPQEEWEACNNGPCAKDCVLGDWAPWSQCPSCGQASRSRRRSIVEQGAFGGVVCDFTDLSESEACQIGPCAVDCQVSQWSQWSACSADCGSGSQQRLRSITTQASNGGRQCPSLEDWRQCNNGPCKQPSICDGVRGTQYFANGCTPEFILCSNGQEFPKICPEPSRFDVASKSCRLPQEIAACVPANPIPAPAPKPAPSFFSRIGNLFSYDEVNETPAPAETPAPIPAESLSNDPIAAPV